MPFSAQHILAILFGGITHGDQCQTGFRGGWVRKGLTGRRLKGRIGWKGKQTNEQNKKSRSFYTFYGDCYRLSAH